MKWKDVPGLDEFEDMLRPSGERILIKTARRTTILWAFRTDDHSLRISRRCMGTCQLQFEMVPGGNDEE